MHLPMLIGSLAVSAILGGCAPLQFGGEPGLPEARCRAAGAQAELGKTVDIEVADNARAAAGALRSRVIRPGDMVTQDLDPHRLNIEVDDTGRIRRLRCG